jgi:hypothetical protein
MVVGPFLIISSSSLCLSFLPHFLSSSSSIFCCLLSVVFMMRFVRTSLGLDLESNHLECIVNDQLIDARKK